MERLEQDVDRDVENTETLTDDGGEYGTDLTNRKKNNSSSIEN